MTPSSENSPSREPQITSRQHPPKLPVKSTEARRLFGAPAPRHRRTAGGLSLPSIGWLRRRRHPDRAERAINRAAHSPHIHDRRHRREVTARLRQLRTALRHEVTDLSSGEVTVTWYAPGAPLAPIADGWCYAPRSGVRLLQAGHVLAYLEEPVAFEVLLLGRLVATSTVGVDEQAEPVLLCDCM